MTMIAAPRQLGKPLSLAVLGVHRAFGASRTRVRFGADRDRRDSNEVAIVPELSAVDRPDEFAQARLIVAS
jgi:hypothetical protein